MDARSWVLDYGCTMGARLWVLILYGNTPSYSLAPWLPCAPAYVMGRMRLAKTTRMALAQVNSVWSDSMCTWLAVSCMQASELQHLCAAHPNRAGWTVTVRHIERVKWYAPRVRHIVVDVELRPPNYQPPPTTAHQTPTTAHHSRTQSGNAKGSHRAPDPAAHAARHASPSPQQPPRQPSTPPPTAQPPKTSPTTATSHFHAVERKSVHTTCGSDHAGGRAGVEGATNSNVPWFRRPVSELRCVSHVQGVSEEALRQQVGLAVWMWMCVCVCLLQLFIHAAFHTQHTPVKGTRTRAFSYSLCHTSTCVFTTVSLGCLVSAACADTDASADFLAVAPWCYLTHLLTPFSHDVSCLVSMSA